MANGLSMTSQRGRLEPRESRLVDAARHEDEARSPGAASSAADLVVQIEPRHSRHVHVAQDRRRRCCAREQLESRAGRSPATNTSCSRPSRAAQRGRHRRLVVDDEHPSLASPADHRGCRRSATDGTTASECAGRYTRNVAPFPQLALQVDLAAQRANDGEADRQPQAGAHADRFHRVERVEDAALQVPSDAHAGVAHLDERAAAVGRLMSDDADLVLARPRPG